MNDVSITCFLPVSTLFKTTNDLQISYFSGLGLKAIHLDKGVHVHPRILKETKKVCIGIRFDVKLYGISRRFPDIQP
jgi:hypothetical protein